MVGATSRPARRRVSGSAWVQASAGTGAASATPRSVPEGSRTRTLGTTWLPRRSARSSSCQSPGRAGSAIAGRASSCIAWATAAAYWAAAAWGSSAWDGGGTARRAGGGCARRAA